MFLNNEESMLAKQGMDGVKLIRNMKPTLHLRTMSLDNMKRELQERYEKLVEKIPYGSENMVGARISFLRGILPRWGWVKERRLLTSPNKKITIHRHFTEISEDLVSHRDEIMEAMITIRSVFTGIPVGLFMTDEPAALDLFKERAKPSAEVLNNYGID